MNLQPGSEDEPEVNLTPLIDVIFLMLIFFMVSTTFDQQARIKIDLPEASAEPASTESETLELVIDARGRYFLGERQVINTTPETLKLAISKALGDRAEVPVTIRADANTPHQSVITALDVTSQLGLTRISLATSKTKE